MRFTRCISFALAVLACAVSPAVAFAAEYPERAITIIIPYPPGGTPKDIIDKLHRAVVAAVESRAVREEFEKRSIIVTTSRSPAAFAAELKADIAQKEKIVAETGIAVE